MKEIWQQTIIEFIRDFFTKSGLSFYEYDSVGDWLLYYFNFKFKFIPRQKWQLRVSKELSDKLDQHSMREDCFEIFLKASGGLNLNPHQSKGLRDVNVHDRLFNDWGIQHLHLNSAKQKKSNFFQDRSDFLLLVRFEDGVAYFIDIVKHKETDVWSLTDYIRIIQRSWPTLLEKYELGKEMWPNLNDTEIGILRKKGYTFPINVDGKSYFTLNHGYATSGANFMAGRYSNEVIRWGHENRDLAKSNKSEFIVQLKSAWLGLS